MYDAYCADTTFWNCFNHSTHLIKLTKVHTEEDRSTMAAPVVNGLKPTMGPSNGGGCEITIRGNNLGVDADDVVGMFFLIFFYNGATKVKFILDALFVLGVSVM